MMIRTSDGEPVDEITSPHFIVSCARTPDPTHRARGCPKPSGGNAAPVESGGPRAGAAGRSRQQAHGGRGGELLPLGAYLPGGSRQHRDPFPSADQSNGRLDQPDLAPNGFEAGEAAG